MGGESEDFLSEAAKVAEHCRRGVGDDDHRNTSLTCNKTLRL